jgi:eukaryotic-like serine/threonine-protein kinase
VSVESLPGATRPLGALPRGAGRLFVSAAPGWCALSVDGKERGPTPLAGVDLPAGVHKLECRAPGGKLKTSTVTLADGVTQRFKFTLDD